MRMLTPIEMSIDKIVDAMIPEDTQDPWNAATTYALADEAIAGNFVYRSTRASNRGNDPVGDDGTNWINVASTNRWTPFDQYLSHRVEQANVLSFTLSPGEICDGIALFGVGADTVTITARLEGEQIWREVVPGNDSSIISDWFRYFFWDSIRRPEIVLTGIPPYSDIELHIELMNRGSIASLSEIVLGRILEIGCVEPGTRAGFLDFSTKTRDDFGNVSVTERDYIRTVDFDFSMPGDSVRFVLEQIESRRAKPTVFFDTQDSIDKGTVVYGFPKDTDIVHETFSVAKATLEVEGLT